MENLNAIGLDKEKSKALVVQLGDLLSNYSIFYQNTRGYHWNIKGDNFFELHVKFEELYNDLILKIDDVAERILTLGSDPEHKFSAYLDQSEIKEASNLNDGKIAIADIINCFKILLIKQRGIMDFAAEIGDEGTSALMSDYIREQEKLIWMYSAYLK
ncbi:MAG: DNA starvation/stationary phase protection protein [Flavobacteriales bacterium]|nr:DNA starvation/stationary phase protection protein [Flavobacteriales bacterium]